MRISDWSSDVCSSDLIHRFHTTSEPDQEVFERLARDARLAQVRLHIMVDARDGLLTGERLRSAVPEWRNAGIWFCGPAGFGEALQRDLAGHRSAEHPYELQSLMSITYAVSCLNKQQSKLPARNTH